jgi:hypothetical protein
MESAERQALRLVVKQDARIVDYLVRRASRTSNACPPPTPAPPPSRNTTEAIQTAIQAKNEAIEAKNRAVAEVDRAQFDLKSAQADIGLKQKQIVLLESLGRQAQSEATTVRQDVESIKAQLFQCTKAQSEPPNKVNEQVVVQLKNQLLAAEARAKEFEAAKIEALAKYSLTKMALSTAQNERNSSIEFLQRSLADQKAAETRALETAQNERNASIQILQRSIADQKAAETRALETATARHRTETAKLQRDRDTVEQMAQRLAAACATSLKSCSDDSDKRREEYEREATMMAQENERLVQEFDVVKNDCLRKRVEAKTECEQKVAATDNQLASAKQNIERLQQTTATIQSDCNQMAETVAEKHKENLQKIATAKSECELKATARESEYNQRIELLTKQLDAVEKTRNSAVRCQALSDEIYWSTIRNLRRVLDSIDDFMGKYGSNLLTELVGSTDAKNVASGPELVERFKELDGTESGQSTMSQISASCRLIKEFFEKKDIDFAVGCPSDADPRKAAQDLYNKVQNPIVSFQNMWSAVIFASQTFITSGGPSRPAKYVESLTQNKDLKALALQTLMNQVDAARSELTLVEDKLRRTSWDSKWSPTSALVIGGESERRGGGAYDHAPQTRRFRVQFRK